MQVVIIEDEQMTAEDLAVILLQLPYGITIPKILSSVKEAVEYFQDHRQPELIFCDIQLGDGRSFDIFKLVDTNTPVIFCTAFNNYALEAFNNNGVGYVLKPFTKRSVKEAIDRFQSLRKSMQNSAAVTSSFPNNSLLSYTPALKASTILVNRQDRIIPVKIADIALFGVDHKSTRLITKTNQDYMVSHTLEELELLCGEDFYRANRQYLINRSAITEVLQYNARKLFVKLNIEGSYDLTIAKAKVSDFLSWLKC